MVEVGNGVGVQMTRRLNDGVYYIGSPPFCHNTALSLFVEHIKVELIKLGTREVQEGRAAGSVTKPSRW